MSKYYAILLNDENEYICCECRTVVDEGGGEYSFEQIVRMFVFDFDSEQLSYYENPPNVEYYEAEIDSLDLKDSWRSAVLSLWAAIEYPDRDEKYFLKRVLDGEFRDMKALVRMVSYATK